MRNFNSYCFQKVRIAYVFIFIILSLFCDINQGFAQNTLNNLGLSSTSPAAGAYGLRKFSSTYAGSAIQVRRSSDNATQNIGFLISGMLDTVALKTFIGASSGYVAIWYDQSGNGKNATQATGVNQPRIASAGVIDYQNGKPTVVFSGFQNLQTTVTGVLATTTGNITTTNAVFKNSTVASSLVGNGTASGNRYNIHAPWSDGSSYFDVGDNAAGGRIGAVLTWASLGIGTFQRNTTQGNIWKNGVNIATSSTMSTTVTSNNNIWIGSMDATSNYMQGTISELIIFPSALSTADRQLLECNQSSYYAITDASPPTISCPAAQTLNLGASCTAVLSNYTSLATVSDNCTATGSIVVTQSPAAGTVLSGVGTQVVTLTATDLSGNTNTCTFNVTKLDVTPPVMACPSNITTAVTAGSCGAIVNYTVSANDNCTGAACAPSTIPGYTLIGTYNGHTYFKSNSTSLWPAAKTAATTLGAHLVTISSAGENSYLSAQGLCWGGMTDETVEGTWVWCNGEPVVYTSWTAGEPNNSGGNQDYLVLNFSGANWDDQGTTTSTSLNYIIEFDCMSLNLVSGLISGSSFPIGTTTVTYNATDGAGNTSPDCSFTITVTDNIAPTVSCTSNITVTAATGACTAPVTYATPVAIDNCGGCSSVAPLTGYTALGVYNGNAYYVSSATTTATAAITAAAAAGGRLASITSAAENTFIRSAVNATAAGTAAYWIGFSDAAAEGTWVWPTCETIAYTNWSPGEPNNSGGVENYAQVYATGIWNDIAGTASLYSVIEVPCITPVLTSGLASGSNFPLGVSTVVYTATDASGNVGTGSFTVTVLLNPASINKTVTASNPTLCSGATAAVMVALSDVGVNYQLRDTANTIVGSPVAGTGGTISLPTGALISTTTFNILATNVASGCSYALTNTVTVTVTPDVTAPLISCLNNITVTAAVGACTAAVSYTAPTVTDNCASCTSAPPIAGFYSLGVYNGNAYYVSTGTANVTTAAAAALAAGGQLASITSAGENTFIRNAVNATAVGTVPFWIGLSDEVTEGTWVWPTCESTSYTNWTSGEPNNSGGTEDNAQVYNNGFWNDITGTYLLNYVIEVPCNTITPVRTAGLASGSNFTVGTNTVTYSATDAAGNTSTRSFNVIVNLNASSINKAVTAAASPICGNTSTNIRLATSDVGVNYQLRDASNNAIGTAVAGTGGTINLPTGNLTATTTFNILATNVAAGCSFSLTNTATVTVNAAPTVTPGSAINTCQSVSPSAITLSGAGVGGGATTGAWTITSGSGTLSSTAQSASPATVTYTAPANYNGTVVLTLTSNFPSGCSAVTGTRTVNVNALPADKTVTASAACVSSASNVQVALSDPAVNYQLRLNATNALVGSAVTGTGGTISLPTGIISSATVYNVLATNSTTGCSRQLTTTPTVAVETVPPVIGCPATQILNVGAACTATLPNYTSLATVSDNCTAASSIVVTQSPAAGSLITGSGPQTVTLTATDASGNSSTCTFSVTLSDITAPVISCPSNITVSSSAGLCGAIVNYSVTATDNCSSFCTPVALPGFTLIGTYNGHTYYKSTNAALWRTAKTNAISLGAHLVSISSAGENSFLSGQGQCWAGLTDEAAEGTWVWANGEPVVYTSWSAGEPNNGGGSGQNYMVINFSGTNWDDQGLAASGTLNYVIEFDCLFTNLVAGLPSGSLFPVGTSTVTYNAIDAAGNTSSSCSFTVTVTDNTAPVVTPPSNISVTAAVGACTAAVTYSTPVATDNCGSCSTAPVLSGMSLLGTNNGRAYYISTASTYTWSAANSAAIAQGGYLAAIDDAAENTYILGLVASSVGSGTNYWIGLNDAAVEGTYVWSNGQPLYYTNWQAGQPDNGGGTEDYAHIWTAAGTWNDISPTSTMRYVLELPCVPATRTAGLASGSNFPVGVNTVTYSATDAAGNTGTGSFTVTVSLNISSTNKTVTAASSPICYNTGTNIRVALSDVGVNYQLRDASNSLIGSPVAGTGGTINLPTGNLTATTTFNVLATNASAGCSYSLTNTAMVTVNPAATATPGTTLTVCQTGSPVAMTLTGAGVGGSATTGAWSITSGGGTLSSTAQTATPATVTYTPASNYNGSVTLTLTTNTPSGCSAGTSATRTISVTPVISGNSSNGSTNICKGVIPDLLTGNTPTGGNGSFTYLWQMSYVRTSGYAAAPGINDGVNYTPTVALDQTVWFRRVAYSGGCTSNSSLVQILVDSPVTNNTITPPPAICSGGTPATLLGGTPGGGDFTSYSYWWEISTTSAVAGFSVAPGTADQINYTPNAAVTQATWFRRTVTTGGCTSVSPAVQINLNGSGTWVGGSSGDWNNAANWCAGIPTSSTDVTIPAGVTINIQSGNAVANSVTISATGSLVMTGSHNLSIAAGGTFTNNGTFNATASTGTVAFLGNGFVSGTTTFKNIDTYGALDFGVASTVSGTFSLQTGGSVTGHSPSYTCPSAVLLYKPGTVFTRGLEWTNASSGQGYPANVLLQNNTTVNFPASGNGYVCYDLQIDAGSSLKQNYGGASASLSVGRNVTISGTLELGGSSGGDITVGGNWTRNAGGVFNANDRKVTFDGPANLSGNGTSMSTISAPASAAKNNEGGFGGEKFAHIWINKTNATDSVVLLSNITVTRELGLTKGTFSLRNSDVTLVSNSTRTADVAPVTTPANVAVRYGGTGKFAVQRFVQNPTATRSWRLLTAPLQSATAPSINEAYMEGVVNPDKNNPNGSGGIYNPWPGFGLHITGPGGTYSAANGFDQGTNSSSILYSNPGTLTWLSPSSTIGTKVTDQQGWMLFVRGDRGFVIGDQYSPAQNTTLEPKGRINIGNVTVPVTAGRQVIGNPYASAISLLNVDISGVAGKLSSYHLWDPKMFTSYTQPGKWVSFTGLGSSFVQTTSASAYAANGTVESGMAFLVDALTPGVITFHESDKLALTSSLVGISNATGARPVADPVFAMFRADVYAKSDTTFKLTDGVLTVFHSPFDDASNAEDAQKIISFNTKESLSILRDATKIAIEKRSDIRQTDTVFFAMSKFNEIPYRFRFEATNFPAGYQAFLEDNFTGDRSVLSTSGVSEIDFTITADPLSKAENRFRVVFKEGYIVLPVTFTNVKAAAKQKNIAVQWTISNEQNIKEYEVQKSSDASHFEKVNSTPSLGDFSGSRTYNWLDENAFTGDNYYRIASRSLDGRLQYSNVVKVTMANGSGNISLYENPVTGNNVRLRFTNIEKGEYTVRLLNEVGQAVKETKVNHFGGTALRKVFDGETIENGAYHIEVVRPGLVKTVLKLVIQ